MSNQRPPGGDENPTHDPGRETPKPAGHEPPEERGAAPEPSAGTGPQLWIDPDRTKRFTSPRRSIVDRLGGRSEEPAPPPPGAGVKRSGSPPPGAPRGPFRPIPLGKSPRRAGRLIAILAAVIVVGLAGGGAAAWFSGWKPGFLTTAKSDDVGKSTPEAPGTPATPPGEKPGDPPKTPATPELAQSCFASFTEVKAGQAACGFALDVQGSVSVQGAKLADRLMAGSAPAQRLILYPFSPSARFVFFRACESASGGQCAAQRLADTKERKLFDVRGGADGFNWVAWSPKEQVGLLGYRDGISETVAAIATADGKTLNASAIKPAKAHYALVKQRSLRWPNEESFSVEVKLCPMERGGGRNAKCEQDDDVRYRRRVVKLTK